MSAPQPQVRSGLSVFRDDEPVTGSMAEVLTDAAHPRFGDSDVWNFNGVIRRPANLTSGNWKVTFNQAEPIWNLRAREMAMIGFNPRHEAILDRGISLAPGPRGIKTVAGETGYLRDLSDWAITHGLPSDLTLWIPDYLQEYLRHLSSRLKRNSLRPPMTVIRNLYVYGPALTGGGLLQDPWDGEPINKVLDLTATPEPTTRPIPPEVWFPIIRATWAYIDVYGPDILRSLARWQEIRDSAASIGRRAGWDALDEWIADQRNLVPIKRANDPDSVNWTLLARQLGADNNVDLFEVGTAAGERAREQVLAASQSGRCSASLLTDLRLVDRSDGTHGPWHESLGPREIWYEAGALRNACYIFVAALSMMRDSELREITKDSLVEHYGSPAVRSCKRKKDPDLPTEHWWIIEPVAQAIRMAAQLSKHPNLAFGAVRDYEDGETLFDSRVIISSFIDRVNKTHSAKGLEPIPDAQRANPHMFRRTMAMLTREFPAAEIALGIQLKHAGTRALANRSTPGYYAADNRWDKYFDQALASARLQRLADLYATHRDGNIIGYGPGADRLRTTFDAVTEAADTLRANGQAQHGDSRVEYELLRKTRFSIRFGKLNHCTMDDANPAGAKCIEDAIVPDGHTGPLIDRCQPGLCANSFIAPEHIPIWSAERESLAKLQQAPKLGQCRREALQLQLDQTEDVLRRVTP